MDVCLSTCFHCSVRVIDSHKDYDRIGHDKTDAISSENYIKNIQHHRRAININRTYVYIAAATVFVRKDRSSGLLTDCKYFVTWKRLPHSCEGSENNFHRSFGPTRTKNWSHEATRTAERWTEFLTISAKFGKILSVPTKSANCHRRPLIA